MVCVKEVIHSLRVLKWKMLKLMVLAKGQLVWFNPTLICAELIRVSMFNLGADNCFR